jgi:hypothetical protein
MNKSEIVELAHPKAIKNQIDIYKIIEQTATTIKLKKEGKILELKKF